MTHQPIDKRTFPRPGAAEYHGDRFLLFQMGRCLFQGETAARPHRRAQVSIKAAEWLDKADARSASAASSFSNNAGSLLQTTAHAAGSYRVLR